MVTATEEQLGGKRSRGKRDAILHALRREIIDGRFGPGATLPTRSDLIERFAASPVTIQAAMDQLVRDGFVVARGRNGTFAADYPPHLHHYGLSFSHDPLNPELLVQSPFWRALAQQATRMDWEDRRVRFTVYNHIDQGPHHQDYARLKADVQAERLAGIILTQPWSTHTWINRLDMPVVMFASSVPGYGPRDYSYFAVDLDMQAFRERAMDHLAARGVRRIGMLVGDESEESVNSMRAAAMKRGLELRDEWLMGINLRSPAWARHATCSMVRRPEADRPQGLIVSDDSLVPHVAKALAEAGVRLSSQPGEVMQVVAHGNFPLESSDFPGMTRLGFSVRDALKTAMQIINLARRPIDGHGPAEVTRLAPVFEEEFKRAAVGASVH